MLHGQYNNTTKCRIHYSMYIVHANHFCRFLFEIIHHIITNKKIKHKRNIYFLHETLDFFFLLNLKKIQND